MKQQILDTILQFLGSAVVAFALFFAIGFLNYSLFELSFFQRVVLSGTMFGLMFGLFIGKPHAGLISLLVLGTLFVTNYWQRTIPCIIWPAGFGDFVCGHIDDLDHAVFWAVIAASITSFFVGLIRKYQNTLFSKNS